jgi:hypothetical protein
MAYPGATEPFELAGEGAFDAASERAALSFDFSSFARLLGGLFEGVGTSDLPDFDSDAWTIDAVQDGTVMYLHFPAVTSELPAGKSWVRIDARTAGAAQGFDFLQLEQFTNNDPRKVLDLLRAASGEIETVGTETLRGAETTHYRAILDLRRYAERAGLHSLPEQLVQQSEVAELPVDVWLDQFGLIRKLEMSVTADSGDAVMRFELWDYGKDVAIDLPPAADVVDAADLG